MRENMIIILLMVLLLTNIEIRFELCVTCICHMNICNTSVLEEVIGKCFFHQKCDIKYLGFQEGRRIEGIFG